MPRLLISTVTHGIGESVVGELEFAYSCAMAVNGSSTSLRWLTMGSAHDTDQWLTGMNLLKQYCD